MLRATFLSAWFVACRIATQMTDLEHRLEDVDDSTSALLSDSTKAWLQQEKQDPSQQHQSDGQSSSQNQTQAQRQA